MTAVPLIWCRAAGQSLFRPTELRLQCFDDYTVIATIFSCLELFRAQTEEPEGLIGRSSHQKGSRFSDRKAEGAGLLFWMSGVPPICSGKLNIFTSTRPELIKWFPIASSLPRLLKAVRTDASLFGMGAVFFQ